MDNAIQLTDKDIQDILDRNNWVISINDRTGKHELRGKLGSKTYFIKSAEFKTALLVAIREVDANKQKRRANR